MTWKKKLSKNCNLYLILDAEVHAYDRLIEIAKTALQNGVDIIQLRDKRGSAKDMIGCVKKILRICKGRIPLIINDRIDMALATNAAGVHLGQDDISIKAARNILGSKYLIGASCQSLKQAFKAQREGASYIGFGSVFKTLTKPMRKPMDLSWLSAVERKMRIPVFAIGGINRRIMDELSVRGVRRIAVCRDICLAQNPGSAVREFKKALESCENKLRG
ncbi:MAG: thiamine phosphate synthase [Candidatus Omnitrophota bacterium]